MTRLYYTEPALREFEARVLDVWPADAGRWRVTLDRTAFYPTSGGQPFDTGVLGEATVVEVLEDEDGRVVHVVTAAAAPARSTGNPVNPDAQPPLAPGAVVQGRIDWARRFDHMQQHTGQHVLSAAFERLHHVRTESFRMGTEFSTIDLAREVSPAEVTQAEDEANQVVFEGRPVSIRFVSADEASRLPLRKEPVKAGRLRLIDIGGYDLSACGGTHVSRTGEIGLIAVRGTERFRGGTRVEFVCGNRAVRSYRLWREAATGAARLLSALPAELPAAVERVQEDSKAVRRAMKALAERAAQLEAGTLHTRAQPVGHVSIVVLALEGYDAGQLKMLASSFVREPSRAIVLFTTSPPLQVVASRSADVDRLDCAALLKPLFQQFGGKGGGKPEAAQGGGLSASADALVAAASAAIRAALLGHETAGPGTARSA